MAFILALVGTAQAEPLKIGALAPAFSGLPGVDGKSYGLDDFKDKDVLVVCITCNHCPVAVKYEDRIIEFWKKFGSGRVGFIAINPNNGPADRLDKMKERAKEKGFAFPYVHDASQQVAVKLGATVTPEFFVFNKERQLVYHGTFDNNMKIEKVTKQYVVPAVEATLQGKKVAISQTAPFGCGIEYEKKK